MPAFLSKVITMFPVETYMNYDELHFLYQTVGKTIRNGLEVFYKDTETPMASFFGTFLILKRAFSNDLKYFEKFVEKFTKFVVFLKNDQPQYSAADHTYHHDTQHGTDQGDAAPFSSASKEPS